MAFRFHQENQTAQTSNRKVALPSPLNSDLVDKAANINKLTYSDNMSRLKDLYKTMVTLRKEWLPADENLEKKANELEE